MTVTRRNLNKPPSPAVTRWTHLLFLVFFVGALLGLGCKERKMAAQGAARRAPPTSRSARRYPPSSRSARHAPHPPAELVEIRILHTADEHGWLEPATPPGSEVVEGGAANFLSWIEAFEGYDPDDFLLLSSGDNWTGPAISTWFQGQPVVAAMNLMGYDAAAIGNHEFDFGRSVLFERFDHSEAIHLGANVLDAESGERAGFARPFVITEVETVPVGIVGLANEQTHGCTHPLSTLDLRFADYAETLEEVVPRLRSRGAAVIVVLAHACREELVETVRRLDVRVDAVFGAHCHNLFYEEIGSVPIIGSGWAWRSYGKLTLLFDTEARRVVSREVDLVKVEYPRGGPRIVEPHPALSALVQRWQERTGRAIGKTIGYTRTGIAKKSWAMANWVADSWLWALPEADASMVVFGGLRQFVDPGPITLSDILGMLPFANTLITVEVSGAELLAVLEHGLANCRPRSSCYPAVGGLTYESTPRGVEIEFFDGRPLDPEGEYTMVVTDYMYFGGSGYPFAHRGGGGAFTGINWRTPVIEWTRAMETSAVAPLEDLLDPIARNR